MVPELASSEPTQAARRRGMAARVRNRVGREKFMAWPLTVFVDLKGRYPKLGSS